MLIKSKPPKSNITKEEELALKNLRSNEDIVILKVDKGGSTVVLNRADYNTKMLDHLTTSGSYRKLSKTLFLELLERFRK